MSSVELTTLDGPEKTPPAPVGMVSHLKHLIESLPVCVMRTDLNGCLLAANDSALQLLGVTEHANVLSKSLTERISAEHTEDWRFFLQRSWTEGAGSLECELIDFNGAHRIVLVKSVAQPTHVDGIQSLILTAQDLASRRRLERALNEHQGCATTIGALQTELQELEAERQRLTGLLEASQTQSGPSLPTENVATATLKRRIEELQATLTSKEKECEQRTNEQLRHAELAAERDAEHQALGDALRNRLSELERSVADKDEEWQKRCDALTTQVAELAAERTQLVNDLQARDEQEKRLSQLVEQRSAERQQLSSLLEQREADHRAESERLQQRINDLERSLKAAEQEWQKRSSDLSATLAEHTAARLQLTNALAERDADHKTAGDSLRQRIEELEQNLKTSQETLRASERQWQKRCNELTAQLADASAERERLAKVLEQRSTDYRAAGSSLQHRIDELERALKANEQAWQKQRTALSTELVTHLTEQERLSALLKQRDEEYHRASDVLKERDEEHQRLSGLLTRREDEHRRLSELLTQRDGEHQRASELLKQRDVEYQRVSDSLKHREEERERLFASLRQRDAEQDRQGALLMQLEQERERLSDALKQREQERQDLSDSLKQQESERQELSELLEQKEGERQQLAESLKQLEVERQKLADLLKHRDADHQATIEGLDQQIVEFERALAASDESWKARCEELSNELTKTDQERTRRWEELNARLLDHATERQRLSDELERREAEGQRLVERHETDKIRIEQSVRGECERAQAHVEETRRLEIDGLRHDIRQLVDDLQGTAAQLNQRTVEYDRLMDQVTAAADPSEVVDPADVGRLMKSFAAYRIELVQVTENTVRTLEPMATAGRVAIASSRELQAAVEAVDARSRQLLEQCALDDVNRPEIERLRRDSIGAASLVRQLLQVFGESTRLAGRAEPQPVEETN